MLGRTAKWLRMLGFNVFYDNKAADADLKKLCLEENRVLLTKDVALHESMPHGSSRLVAAVHTREQLAEVVSSFRLDRFALHPRCSLCNGALVPVQKESVQDWVPPYVFRTQSAFQRCCLCRKVYWPGTHLGKIVQVCRMIRKASG